MLHNKLVKLIQIVLAILLAGPRTELVLAYRGQSLALSHILFHLVLVGAAELA